MIKNFKYFRYGYPIDIQAPTYALYQPLLNTFLTVTPNLEIAKKLVGLLTVRYSTCICLINTAKNFTPNIIDNEVCNMWTFDNINDFSVHEWLANHPVVNVNCLIEKTEQEVPWDIKKEKEWILFCAYWLEFLNIAEHKKFSYSEVDRTLGGVLENLPGVYYPEHENIVMKMLFFGNDIDQVDKNIRNYLQTTELFELLVDYDTAHTQYIKQINA